LRAVIYYGIPPGNVFTGTPPDIEKWAITLPTGDFVAGARLQNVGRTDRLRLRPHSAGGHPLTQRLDDRRDYRLHVWDRSYCEGDPPIHDHPYEFSSAIIAGEVTNTRYVEDPEGDEYVRFRYSLPDESQRRSDLVRLSGSAETVTEGGEYRQRPVELHASWQEPGTVTVIRCSWGPPRELTVCLRDEDSWRSGAARDATREEIKKFAAKALEWF